MGSFRLFGALLMGALVSYSLTYATAQSPSLFSERGQAYDVAIEGETVTLAKDRPKISLSRWNQEEELIVRPLGTFGGVQIEGAVARYPGSETVVVEVLKGDMALKAGTRGEEAVKIDIELSQKPATNTFLFALEGWEDLEFYYQPELTPEQIERGAVRAENIVGSYAVYHATKRDHQVGQTNYQNGKMFHIYRPKIVDASGAWVWGELSYDAGTLSVTVPEAFLETATYPVRVDPTFGYTTAGGTAANIARAYQTRSIRWGMAASSTATSSVSSIHTNLSSTVSTQSIDVTSFLNYEDTQTNSLQEVVRSERNGLSIGTTQDWYTFTPTSTKIIGIDDFVISVVGDGTDVGAGNDVQVWYDASGSRNSYYTNVSGASSYTTNTESPWATAELPSGELWSMYVTYTALCQ
jgi:hypothetical protein